ncbi:hypothetical protein DPF_2079 [Desulfoplanes formicivorans]|uniref:Lipoprotein n=2 Tax=Desulfoplanes formicivorans TaxID=1592317 RepID=A0A194AJX2_9BACT|nr:hypothetical protein DPF_2079 [Desulfoplanes formicivorans]
MPVTPHRLALLLPVMLFLFGCTRVPDPQPVFDSVRLYTESIDLTMHMLANDALYQRLEQSLPNIKRAHGLEKERCLILTGWSPFSDKVSNPSAEHVLHQLEKSDWHLHKKHPDKTITSRLIPIFPCALEFTMRYTVDDTDYVDMGMDVITRDNYLFSIKIHGNATVMDQEHARFRQEFDQIRRVLKTLHDQEPPQT